jgi:hypothetical protein
MLEVKEEVIEPVPLEPFFPLRFLALNLDWLLAEVAPWI